MISKVNVIWLGFAVPKEIAYSLFAMDPLPAIQTHKFGWSFARALRFAFGEVTLASSCPVQRYPLVRCLVFRRGTFTSQGISGVLLGFINVIVLKHLTRLMACLITLIPLVRRKNVNWIFIHGLHTPYLVFGLLARLFGCRIAVVLTDPPGVVLPTDGWLARLLKGMDAWLIKKILGRMDAMFALAPDLVRCLAPGRPALIFPGIFESTLDDSIIQADRSSESVASNPYTILYAGGLSKAYGVDRLVNAVLDLQPEVSICLKLFGRGDQEDMIRKLAAENPRFFYGGFVNAEYLVTELYAADLLINPRPTDAIFTALSFPSKLIEYLATGRPVLTTQIPSIPNDLKNHFYYISDESPEGIRASICALMELPMIDRVKHGMAAQNFVRAHYSEAMIGRKIAEFIENLNL